MAGCAKPSQASKQASAAGHRVHSVLTSAAQKTGRRGQAVDGALQQRHRAPGVPQVPDVRGGGSSSMLARLNASQANECWRPCTECGARVAECAGEKRGGGAEVLSQLPLRACSCALVTSAPRRDGLAAGRRGVGLERAIGLAVLHRYLHSSER